jgi:hypothetical protein
MAETSTIRVSAVCPADRATRARSGGSRQWRARLWALLNAQSLIRGTAGAPGDVAFIEDDRHRLARRGR